MTGPTSPPPTAAELSADPELASWRVLLGRLAGRWRTDSFAQGAQFVAGVAALADHLDHHPDVDLRYRHVTVTTVSHDVGRLTRAFRDGHFTGATPSSSGELTPSEKPP